MRCHRCGFTYEWRGGISFGAVVELGRMIREHQALTDARADEVRDTIAELAHAIEGHIPDMTTVNLGAILARLAARADKLEAGT